jgi:hypothetical protein
MQSPRLLVTLLAMLLAFGVNRAAADPISLAFDFVATGFGAGAPVDPVVGSFFLFFDNSANILDRTTGLTVSHLNITVDTGVQFGYGAVADALVIGGAFDGAQTISAGTNDFLLSINNASTNPTPVEFLYAQASSPTLFKGTAILRPAPAVTPEPATFVLIVTGLAVTLGRGRFVKRRETWG